MILNNTNEAWDWLARVLEPALVADESEFLAVSAQDVINRNKGK